MERYEPETESQVRPWMQRGPHGEWVSHAEAQSEIARLQAEVGRLTEFIRYAGEAVGGIHSAALVAAKAEITRATAPVTYAEIDAATADPIEDCAAGFNKDALRIAVIVQRIIAARAMKGPPA